MTSDDVFVKPEGASRIRMNPRGTYSLFVGIDDTTAVFDVTSNTVRQQDLQMFDVLTQTRSEPPAGVNTGQNEFRPSISGDWLLFDREGNDRTRIILFNMSTSEQRVLVNLRASKHFLYANQVNGDWATYGSCDLDAHLRFFHDCQVSLYQISTDTLTQISNPNRQQFASSVSSDGTAYFVRGRNREREVCGSEEQIIRLPNGGSETAIATIPEGKHVTSTFSFHESDASTTLLFGRESCRSRLKGGIFEILNADTAS